MVCDQSKGPNSRYGRVDDNSYLIKFLALSEQKRKNTWKDTQYTKRENIHDTVEVSRQNRSINHNWIPHECSWKGECCASK